MQNLSFDLSGHGQATPAVRRNGQWSAVSWLAVSILGYLWFILAKQLSSVWSVNLQYGYGWYVPPFCGLLCWRRWKTRPAPESPKHIPIAISVIGFCALLVFPVRLLFEVAAELRVLHWLLAVSVVSITVCGVYLVGGRSWARHFAFPIGFIFVAVPWLLGIEQPFIQFLTRTVTALSVELLNLIGIPAMRSGNVIQTLSGPVGVGEACSGVRSFQGTMMISLFLGELLHLHWHRRGCLVVIGFVVAFGLNLVRVFFLAWNASQNGLESIGRLHDSAGMGIFWISFLIVWGIAEWMRYREPATAALPADSLTQIYPLSRTLVVALGCWLVFSAVGIELWYRITERQQALNWTVSLPPPNVSNFEPLTMPDAVREKLQHDREITGSWTADDGAEWRLFFFRWERGPVYSRIMARFHRPEACFPAGGSALIADHGIRVFNCGGVDLPFRAYEFDFHGQLVRVFYCTDDDQVGARRAGDSKEWETALDRNIGETSRIRKIFSVWRGGRRMAQQTLEVMVSGYPTQDAADAAMRLRLPDLIQFAHDERPSK